MRIGVDVGLLGPNQAGVARYLWNMVSEMGRLDPRLEFLLYAPSEVQIPLGPGNWRLRVPRRTWPGPYYAWLQSKCPRMMAEDRIDVFWGQNYLLPLRLARPCLRLLTIHDLTAVLYPWTMSLRARLIAGSAFRKAVHAADVIVAVSQATARLAAARLGADEDRVHVIYEGCDSRFRPPAGEEAGRAVAAEYGLQPGRYILAVSTIEPRKDYPTLLRALDSIPHAPVLAIVGGEGWRCRGILEQIRAHEARGQVKYLGKVGDTDLSSLYSAAELMVYPSVYEGFGLPVLEAMTCGCPVLCSWSSSLPEVGGGAVRYFRPRDDRDLTQQLGFLLSRQETLAEMSALGRSQAAKFSFRAAAGRFLSILHRQVEG